MSISGINFFNTKIQQLSQYADAQSGTDNSLFGAKLSIVSEDMVEDLLKQQGMNETSVVKQLLTFVNADADNEDLIKLLSDEFEELVEAVHTQIKSEDNNVEDEEQSEETATDTENENTENTEEGETTQTQTTEETPQLTESPIQSDTLNWNMEDTGNIFTENITQDKFLEGFNALNDSLNEDDYFSQYMSSINDIGAENFFATLDANGDGSLDNTELEALTNADGDNTSISADEFNNIFNKYLEESGYTATPSETPVTPSETPATPSETPAVQTPASETPVSTPSGTSGTSGSSGSSGSSYNPSSVSSQDSVTASEEPQETVEDLVKQKQEIITQADTQISDLNKQIDDLVSNSDIDAELKENYKTAKDAYDANQKSISDNETKIQSYDSNLHDISRSIASLEGEKSTLATDTNDEEVNKKNSARKTEIDKSISELKAKQEKIEADKQALETQNTTLKSEGETLKTNLDTAFEAVNAALPDEIKTQISTLKSQIQTIETEKTSKVSEIDAKISTLKTQEIKECKESGEAVGKLASNAIGAKFVEDALKYNGMKGGSKFSTGDYGWCADFVTYVVREVAMQMGMSKEEARQLARDHLGASPQKLVKKNKSNVIETNGLSAAELQQKVQPGMAFICKGGGASGQHTGFVAEVYDDGTFLSIEGNHGNKVCQVRRKLTDMYRYVDFSYLFK